MKRLLPRLGAIAWTLRLAVAFLLLVSVSALFAPLLGLDDPYAQESDQRLQAPSWRHPFGTDDLGRDIFSRVVFGGRVSLSVGLVAVGLAFGVGVPLGVTSGYLGGGVDRCLSVVIEVLMTLPAILLALVMVAILGPSLGNVMLAVGISQIPHFARQARASTLSVREHDYVLAASALGATTFRLLRRHVLPNVLAPVVVVATMGLGGAILESAGLSFLGLAGDPSRPEWGSMLTANRERFLQQPWLVIAPGIAITGTVLSFNIVGDALRDWLDPRAM
ncbi:Glutathione transport system permease protein GsiD [Planctomycetes bacterium Pan216]|uniref:Glutathione transport system permease protein GsiD n=1 Tax=Kolteria novifilia TaxID=2527975 RepID=A0A518B1F9_9BACT|nr:Glutathione transport system permease protein GsiD [Planctomycetes bacterium Pan216]